VPVVTAALTDAAAIVVDAQTVDPTSDASNGTIVAVDTSAGKSADDAAPAPSDAAVLDPSALDQSAPDQSAPDPSVIAVQVAVPGSPALNDSASGWGSVEPLSGRSDSAAGVRPTGAKSGVVTPLTGDRAAAGPTPDAFRPGSIAPTASPAPVDPTAAALSVFGSVSATAAATAATSASPAPGAPADTSATLDAMSATTALPSAAASAAPTVTSAAPTTAVAAPNTDPSPLANQLAKPIFSLQQAATGEHIVTVTVSPESLGPVTVRAHVDASGMRVELFAPTELGRDAIRSILGDLKRDLAGQGLSSTLDLSSQNRPSDSRGQASPREIGAHISDDRAPLAIDTPAPEAPQRHRHNSTLDVLA
jgi:flagellar hook-length control protein FliK